MINSCITSQAFAQIDLRNKIIKPLSWAPIPTWVPMPSALLQNKLNSLEFGLVFFPFFFPQLRAEIKEKNSNLKQVSTQGTSLKSELCNSNTLQNPAKLQAGRFPGPWDFYPAVFYNTTMVYNLWYTIASLIIRRQHTPCWPKAQATPG